MINAFSLITGVIQERWNIVKVNPRFDIENNEDPVVQEILIAQNITYEYNLYQNKTANEKRPIDIVGQLQQYLWILAGQIPQIVTSYQINSNSYEILYEPQQFSYTPIITNIGVDSASFNVSIKRNGTLYGIVMIHGSTPPNPNQIKYGLNSTNFKVPLGSYFNQTFIYLIKANPNNLNFSRNISIIFTNLYDNTQYNAYFISENDYPINPDLMPNNEILEVSFITQNEYYSIPSDYGFSGKVNISSKMLALIFLLNLYFN